MLTESACSSDISQCPISDGQTNRYHPYHTLFIVILVTLCLQKTDEVAPFKTAFLYRMKTYNMAGETGCHQHTASDRYNANL